MITPAVDVSVAVPTRNRLEFLRGAVASVQAQSLEAWELLVVDDASDDDTPDWLAAVRDPRVRTVRLETHSERSAARNAGLTAARGDFVLFLDDDDLLRPDALAQLTAALRAAPEAVAAVGAVVGFDERDHRRRFRHPRRGRVRDVLDDVMFGWVGLPGATLFRAGVLRDAGGWNERLTQGEDQELSLRLALRGPTAIVPHVVVEQRLHTGQRRPRDTFEIETALREDVLRDVNGHVRERAERAARARLEFRDGVMAWVQRRPREALGCFTAGIRSDPSLVHSPLVGRRVRSLWLRCAIGSLVGGRALLAAYRLVWWARRRTRRAPYSMASAIPDVTGVPLVEDEPG